MQAFGFLFPVCPGASPGCAKPLALMGRLRERTNACQAQDIRQKGEPSSRTASTGTVKSPPRLRNRPDRKGPAMDCQVWTEGRKRAPREMARGVTDRGPSRGPRPHSDRAELTGQDVADGGWCPGRRPRTVADCSPVLEHGHPSWKPATLKAIVACFLFHPAAVRVPDDRVDHAAESADVHRAPGRKAPETRALPVRSPD